MSSTQKKLTINATSSMVQVAFTALLYFFLYKYLLNSLGVQQLGVWSLILSFSSIANLANLGLTSGLVKFVADYIADVQEDKIGKLILTAFLSLSGLFLLVGIFVMFGAKYLLHFVIDQQFLSVAFSIFPLSLGSLCVNAASGVFTSVLEGYQKNYLRNFIYIFSGIVMYVATLMLTPVYKLQGVAIAQLMQGVFIFIMSLITMIKISPNNHFRNWKWSNQSFAELFNYGFKFQVVSISQLLYEPTTKLLLSKFGGLALLGHYEMASRLVNQFRALLVSANQVVIPVIAASVKTKSKAYLREFYTKMNRIMLLFTLPLSTLLITLTPLISIIWIGTVNHDFTFAMYVLTVSATFNILCGPAYFSCLGEGRLSILVIVHIMMAIGNLVLGYLLGQWLGGYGIMLAWAIALSLGSIVLPVFYNKKMYINLKDLYTNNELVVWLIGLLVCVFSLVLFSLNLPAINDYVKSLVCVVLMVLFIPVVLNNINVKNLLFNFRKRL